jgi:hypothetical protein
MRHILKFFLLAAFGCLLAVGACHKHDHGDDTTPPELTITSPAADAIISGAVTISGTVTDESLHEMQITVNRDSDNAELFKAQPKVHDLKSYAIAETWTPTGLTGETAVTLTVTVEDHSDHKVTKTVRFKVKP